MFSSRFSWWCGYGHGCRSYVALLKTVIAYRGRFGRMGTESSATAGRMRTLGQPIAPFIHRYRKLALAFDALFGGLVPPRSMLSGQVTSHPGIDAGSSRTLLRDVRGYLPPSGLLARAQQVGQIMGTPSIVVTSCVI